MPSSISSSDHPLGHVRIDRFTIALLCTAFALLALTEAVSVVSFDRTSKVQRRELSERRTLLGVRDPEASDDPRLLASQVAGVRGGQGIDPMRVPHQGGAAEPLAHLPQPRRDLPRMVRPADRDIGLGERGVQAVPHARIGPLEMLGEPGGPLGCRTVNSGSPR